MVRQRIIKIVFFALILGMGLQMNSAFNKTTFMDLDQAKKKWGSVPFNPNQFKKGDEISRSKMVVSLIESKKYLGKKLSTIPDELGKSDGFFENDAIPAYLLTPPKKENSEIWQVVFIPDKEWKRVNDVKIHKNCCN